MNIKIIAADCRDTQQRQNLLANPDFEGAFLQYGSFRTAVVAEGWIPWWMPQTSGDPPWRNRMPEYKPSAPYKNRIHSGSNAQQLFTAYGTHIGGIYQIVGNVQPGDVVRFTIWGHAWAGQGDDPYRSVSGGPMRMAVGIDPTGGISPYSERVVWVEERNPLDEWALFTIEVTATGGTVTVFTRSAPEYPTKHNDVYWDDAQVVVIGHVDTPETTISPPTPVAEWIRCGELCRPQQVVSMPTSTVAPTRFTEKKTPTRAPANATVVSRPVGETTKTVTVPIPTPATQFGKICASVYLDTNGNRRRDPGEELPAGDTAMVSQRENEWRISDGDLRCLELPPGEYVVSFEVPAGYTATTSRRFLVRLAQEPVTVEVGARAAQMVRALTLTSDPIRKEQTRSPLVAPYIVVAIGMVGVGILIVLRRRAA